MKSFEELAKEAYGDAIKAYSRGDEALKSQAVRDCYPAVAALELDESYASLVLTARMDHLLAKIIERGAGRQGSAKKLLYDFPKPLSGFSAKINMAFFLGFITEQMQTALDCSRNVRNAYAHSDSPDDARQDKKYVKHKRKLLNLDSEYTDECLRQLSELNGNDLDKDTHGVSAIMLNICDSLSSVVNITGLYSSSIKPKVIPAIYGFEDPS